MERFNYRYKRDMKTAIEWLEEQMETWGHFPRWMRDDIVKKAKEMEKKQIIDAYDEAKVEGMCLATNSEYKHLQGFEYYNETFKTN